MAGAARYTAILDANVLYPRFARDMLLSLAHADLYNAKWTADIEREWTSSLRKHRPDSAEKIAETAATMCRAIPDCMVTGYEHLIDSLTLPDANDRHVLAAAIVGHADAIVTWNTKHFPRAALEPHHIELQTPDEFVVNQITLNKISALSAIKKMRERWQHPLMTSADLIELFARRQMPVTAAHLSEAVDLI